VCSSDLGEDAGVAVCVVAGVGVGEDAGVAVCVVAGVGVGEDAGVAVCVGVAACGWVGVGAGAGAEVDGDADFDGDGGVGADDRGGLKAPGRALVPDEAGAGAEDEELDDDS
jgi:hypothetical protein